MNLVGLHDREALAIAKPDTWILDTVALSEHPAPFVYTQRHHWITRLNWGYGNDTGTLPLPEKDNEFFSSLVRYVERSQYCHRWLIGNEPNLPREWPKHQAIHPSRYAEIFTQAVKIIRGLPGHAQDEVLIAASGPWNADYRYAGNTNGDWIKYFQDQIQYIPAGLIGGFSIHAYTHGYDKNLAVSDTWMNPPFQNRHYDFRTYRDYCLAIPDSLAHLPVYITEANGNGPWQASGLMPAMAWEIDQWNQTSIGRKIRALIFYRYPDYDGDIKFHIAGKHDVIDEYYRTVATGYESPALPVKIFLPQIDHQLPAGTVTATVLNVRNQFGVDNTEIVGTLVTGQKISIYDKKLVGDQVWYRIGDNAWVAGKYVELGNKPDTTVGDHNKWRKSLEFVLKWEGDWADHPSDPGGATMKGITLATYTRWRAERGQPAPSKEELRAIPQQTVAEIYYSWYWLLSGADKLPWPMCLAVFDLAVNGGVGRALEFNQKYGLDFDTYMIERMEWYTRINNFEVFGRAWIRRCLDLMRTAKQ